MSYGAVGEYVPYPSNPSPDFPPQFLEKGPSGRWRAFLGRYLIPAVVLAGVAVVVVTHHSGGSGPSYPSAWDPRVLPSVRFVEKARGLTFKHPIYVDFLSNSAFREKVDPAGGDETQGEKDAAELQASELRALGLIDGNIDTTQEAVALQGDDVVGLYDFATKRIAVRGQTLSLAATTTLVHELTHALQDQYYDISAHQIAQTDVDGRSAFLDLIEGDAVRIQDEYVDSLSPAQQAVERAQELASVPPASADDGVPQIIEATEIAPYVLGPEFARFVVDGGDSGAIDGAFVDPPTADMQVLQPWRFVTSDGTGQFAVQNDQAGLGKLIDSGNFGAVQWYLMLADKLGPAAAMRAVDGWDGDSFAAYQVGAKTCVQLTYVATDAPGLKAMSTGLAAWAKSVPGNNVKIASDKAAAHALSVQTCDPGVDAKPEVKGQMLVALHVAAVRIDIADELVKSEIDPLDAGCEATVIAEKLNPARLSAVDVAAVQKAQTQAAQLACP